MEPSPSGRGCAIARWCSGGLVYLAAAWGFLQGLEYMTGTYDWPRQIHQLTTLALLIGLPIVLVLAWVTEELERLAIEMHARGLSVRDIERTFTDSRGECLLSKSAVAELSERL